jgi:diguanylate cyclase (GGDEF)-like protein/PAS domain S-box-containing protein
MIGTDERLGVLARLPSDVLCLVAADGVPTYVSPSVERALGFSVDEFLRLSGTLEVIHPDERDRCIELWHEVGEVAGREVRAELRVRVAGGGWRWFDVLATNLIDDPLVAAVVMNLRDVNDRHEISEALRDSEARLRTIINSTTDGLVLVDDSGCIRWCNEALERFMHYEPDRMLGVQVLDFVHPDDLVEALPSLARVVGGQSNGLPTLLRVRRGDGEWRWVETLAQGLDDALVPGGAVFSLRDVTERVVSQTALKASEERFLAFLQNSKDLIGVVDPGGLVTWISNTITDMLGWTPEEIVGTNAFDLLHPDDLEEAGAQFLNVVLGGPSPEPLTTRVKKKDGEFLVVEGIGQPMYGADGAIESVLLNVRDVSWRFDAEQAVRRSEERLRALLQNGADGIVVIDEAGIISFVGGSLVASYGWTAEDLLGHTCFDVIHADDRDDVAEALAAILMTPGAIVTAGFRVLLADGDHRWVEVTAANLLEDSSVTGIVANVRDIHDRKMAEAALEASEVRFRTVVSSSYDITTVVDESGIIKWITPNVEQQLGWTAEELEGADGIALIHPDNLAFILDELARFTSGAGVPNPRPIKIRHKDGRYVDVEIVATDFMDHPDIRGLAVNLRDISDRVSVEHESRRLTDIFGLTSDLVGIANVRGGFVYLNEAARRFLGLAADAPIDEFDLAPFVTRESLQQVGDDIGRSLEHTGLWTGELDMIDAEGNVVSMLGQLMAHREDDGKIRYLSGMLRDISERKLFERRLEHEATHDPLTGLPNRTLLLDRLQMALARGKRHRSTVAVLFCDLDHFKVVNDSLGHSRGDEVLLEVAERLKMHLRPGDTVSRFGGDEFVILCEDVDGPDDAISIARRTDHSVSRAFHLDGHEVFVGVSIGIALTDGATDADPEALIRDADAAMYRAKARGRARYQLFEPGIWEQAVDRFDIENALRRALVRGELEVFYQPLVSLHDFAEEGLGLGGGQPSLDLRSDDGGVEVRPGGRIVGVEALVRWNHPERGRMMPTEFIGVAEETGIVLPMGAWVLDVACRQMQMWTNLFDHAQDLTLAVNLSARQLGNAELVDHVRRAIDESGLAASRLHLEITESVLMDDVEMSALILGNLKELGINVAVDDFGTGYSSLSYLRRFPVDSLKVDRSFVDGLGSEPEDSAIVAAIVNLAHTLGLEAVAEGVETEQQLLELASLGCDIAQGFFLSVPVPADELTRMLAAQTPNLAT